MPESKTFEEAFEDAKSFFWFESPTVEQVVERFAQLISRAENTGHFNDLRRVLTFKKLEPYKQRVLETHKILQCQRCLKARLT